MAKIVLEYKNTIALKATKHLKCEPIKIDFSYEVEVDSADASIEKTIHAEFKKTLDNQVKEQMKHMNGWLADKSDIFEGLNDLIKKVAKNGMPTLPAHFAAIGKLHQYMAKNMSGMTEKELKDDFAEIVTGWGQNLAEQQGLIAVTLALKNARATTIKNKNARLKAALALNVVLVVAAVALGIAATVLSFGTLAPVFAGLAVGGLAISGISSIAQLGKTINDNWNTEKRILDKVQGELESLEAALGKAQDASKGLPKYLTELEVLIKVREGEISKAETSMSKYSAEVKGYERKVAELKGNAVLPDGDIAKHEKKIADIAKKIDAISTQITELKKSNIEAHSLIGRLKQLGVDMDAMKRVSPNTLANNIKERMKTSDGWLDLGSNIGGLASSVSGL